MLCRTLRLFLVCSFSFAPFFLFVHVCPNARPGFEHHCLIRGCVPNWPHGSWSGIEPFDGSFGEHPGPVEGASEVGLQLHTV